ncbi:hypothetical protein [Pedobacter jamesrossensis]|uniref:Uncharacterized protein n=1 Tax=Pedobacter jamesrossensis TaxID=1908238 RepID=A0ABV8NM58_9SPHI
MKSLETFKASLKNDSPANNLSIQLKALWYDGKGNWSEAHHLVDQLADTSSAWIHAYLHRKEGDIWNADYWYKKAKKVRPDFSLTEEWEQLVMEFL